MAFQLVANGDIPDEDYFNTLMRQGVIACTSGTRPALPDEGMLIHETDTGAYMRYAGGAWEVFLKTFWVSYTPTFTAVGGNPSMGTGGSIVGRYQQVGRTVHCAIRGLFGTGASAGSGAWSVGLPIAAATTSSLFRVGAAYCRDTSAAGSGHYPAIAVVDTSNPSVVGLFNVTGAVGNAYPFAWAPTDHFAFSLTYEAA